MPIHIGLAGWGDHDRLYTSGARAGSKLRQYANHFPVVEVDSTFYAIQSKERFLKWVEETPSSLHFVVKAYQGMTGHQRGAVVQPNELNQMYAAFREMLEPAIVAGRLKAALFQYPPWFDCTRDNVRLLRETKLRMQGIPCALEFRHQSWFTAEFRDKTVAFMEQEQWIHSVCDEPQAGLGSIPTVLKATDPGVTIVRFHGRNAAGWNQGGGPNWREVRYLYRYSEEELREWVDKLQQLQQESKHICVIFNNNSGGDAADNAKQLMEMLGLTRPDGGSPIEPPPPVIEQLDLF
ncbi:MAG: DUF72 domain-containing protein [Bacillota bacterium]